MIVAVLGLGIIGSPWAENLMNDGVEVRTWNRTPKDFPNFVSSAKEAASGADLVIIVVADPPAVSQVLDQIEPVLRSGQIVMQSSTISAKWTKEFAARVQATGADFLEAPFTGSKLAAQDRKTVYYVGGDLAVLDRIKPILSKISQHIQYVGPIGSASTLKLAMNMNIALVGEALMESLAFAHAHGISDDAYFEALDRNVAHSGVADLKKPKLLGGDYSAQFSLKHMRKDLLLAAEDAGDLPLTGLKNVLELYQRGMDAGQGDEDFIGLVRYVDAKAK